MKFVTKIQFESPFDVETTEIYKTLSSVEIQEFLNDWKVGIEQILRDEIGGELSNFKVDIIIK